jgi:hypothetical protein
LAQWVPKERLLATRCAKNTLRKAKYLPGVVRNIHVRVVLIQRIINRVAKSETAGSTPQMTNAFSGRARSAVQMDGSNLHFHG